MRSTKTNKLALSPQESREADEHFNMAAEGFNHLSKGALLRMAAHDFALNRVLANKLPSVLAELQSALAELQSALTHRDSAMAQAKISDAQAKLFQLQSELAVADAFKTRATAGGSARHAADPKQVEKRKVYAEWLRWRQGEKGHQYESYADFARIECGRAAHLKSMRVIERWCGCWAKGKNIPT